MNYFVTTGTSLRSHSRCWKPEPGKPRSNNGDDLKSFAECIEQGSKELLDTQKKIVETVLCALGDRGSLETPETYLARAEEVVEKYFDANCWFRYMPHLLPAEVATLLVMHHLQPDGTAPYRPPAGSKIVFLCGETNEREAYLCAAVLKQVIRMQSAPVDPITQLTAGNQGLAPIEADLRVSIHPEIFKWNPKNAAEFIKTLEGDKNQPALLGRIGAGKQDAFVLTAGYKGVLIALSLQLSRVSKELPTRIFYLYEDSDDLIAFSVKDMCARLLENSAI